MNCWVFDIRSFEPTYDHAFIVDTNAWYWTTYSRATLSYLPAPQTNQVEQYSRFIKKALDAGATIGRCGLSFSELAHRIENSEKKIYEKCHLGGKEIPLKQFRRDGGLRQKVVSEVRSAWGQVVRMSEHSTVSISRESVDGAVDTFQNSAMAAYDLFIVEAMKQNKIGGILTDDADFATLTGWNIFTCNPRVIAEARKAEKLRN